MGGNAYFGAYDREHGRELWKTDGTPAGTILLADINPGPGGGLWSDPVVANGLLLFVAYDPEHGRELWKTDGTANGTALVADINLQGDGVGSNLTVANGIVFFTGDDGHHIGLWRSDGTPTGTRLLAEMYPGELINVSGTLFVLTEDSLWTSDGTPGGTVHVTDIDSLGCYVREFGARPTAGNGRLYFLAEGLWTSDGTAAGTVRLTSECPDEHFITVNDTTFFLGYDASHGTELWRTDGTVAGTRLVRDITSGPADGFFDNSCDYGYSPQFANANGTLFFLATDGVAGFELWKSDSTEAGTLMVKDVVPGSGGITRCDFSYEYDDARCLPSLIGVGDSLFFTAIDVATVASFGGATAPTMEPFSSPI